MRMHHLTNPSGSGRTAPLQLIIDAVTATNDYSVFSSRPIEIMISYKWRVFGLGKFLRSFLFFASHIVILEPSLNLP